MNKVLILGANGFIGSHIAGWLSHRRYAVRLFDLSFSDFRNNPESGKFELVEGNFLNPADLEKAVDGVEAVLHFISTTVPATSLDNVTVELESNVAATARLLDVMVKKGVHFLGFPSSGGTVYGPGPVDHAEDEPLKPTCPYGLGKVMIEELIRFYHDHRDMHYQIWRIGNPFGDRTKLHQAQGAIDAFLHGIKAGRPVRIWGDGSAVRDFILIDDVVEAIGMLVEKRVRDEVVNIGTGKGVSINEVLEIIRKTVPHDFPVERIPGYTGPPRAVLNVEKLRSFGWRPTHSLEEGIAKVWDRLLL